MKKDIDMELRKEQDIAVVCIRCSRFVENINLDGLCSNCAENEVDEDE